MSKNIYYIIAPGCEEEAEKYFETAKSIGVYLKPLELSGQNKVQCCIYITGYSSGVTAADIVEINERVSSWLIIVSQLDTRLAQFGYKVVKEKWEASLSDKNIALKIIAGSDGYENELIDWLNNEKDFTEYGSEQIYLITSPNPRSGKSLIIQQLSEPDYKFIEIRMDSDEYEAIRAKASKIIFVCDDISDFNILPFDDCLRKSIFVLNKCDNKPILFKNADLLKLSVIKILFKNGWDIAPEHTSKIFLISALYSEYHTRFKNRELSLDFFISDENFSVWDDFGLPVPRSEYTQESIGAILESYDYISNLKNNIFNRSGGVRR